eukprot:bmy_05208T0
MISSALTGLRRGGGGSRGSGQPETLKGAASMTALCRMRRYSECHRGQTYGLLDPWAGRASWKNSAWFDTCSRGEESPGT